MIIIFYHGAYGPHCVEKLEEVADAYVKFEKFEAEVIAVSFDKLAILRTLVERTGVPFPLLSDETWETASTFTFVDPRDQRPVSNGSHRGQVRSFALSKIVSEAHELPDVEEMLSWLLLIQTECPECSHL